MSGTPEQDRGYKSVKLGLIAPIPILAIAILFVASDSGTHHSFVRGVVACLIYLMVIIPTSIYILRKRRLIASKNENQGSFGSRLK